MRLKANEIIKDEKLLRRNNNKKFGIQ